MQLTHAGKSSFANELETSLFDYNKDEDFAVLSFNYEMMASRQVGRKLSFKTSKSVTELYSKNQEPLNDATFDDVKKHADYIKKYNIFYVDTAMSVEEMRSTIERAIKTYKKLVVFIDHARLVKKGGRSEQEMLSELIEMCMELKKQHQIIFVVLSQLNREIEKADRVQNPQGHFPLRSDLFGSDAIFQGSDYVAVVHRPELLNIQSYGVNKLPVKDMVYIHLIKARDGEPKIMMFKNLLKYNRLDEV